MADLNEQAALAAEILGSLALEGRHTIATAESLTGGAVSAAITSVAGASQWFERGFVVYTARAKSEMLDVPPELIEKEGVVSLAVAHAMARGAAARSTADLSVALTVPPAARPRRLSAPFASAGGRNSLTVRS